MKQHDDYVSGPHHYWTQFVCGFLFGGGLGAWIAYGFFREWPYHSHLSSSHRGCICVFVRSVGRAFLAQYFGLAAHLVESAMSIGTLIAESGRPDGIAPVRAPTPPGVRVRTGRFQSAGGGGF